MLMPTVRSCAHRSVTLFRRGCIILGICGSAYVYAQSIEPSQPPLVPSLGGATTNQSSAGNLGQENSGFNSSSINDSSDIQDFSLPPQYDSSVNRNGSLNLNNPNARGYGYENNLNPNIPYGRGNDSFNNPSFASQNFRPKHSRKLSEFERFVKKSTGRVLLPYGNELFDQDNPNYTPIKDVPVPDDYTIGAGDELIIQAWGILDADYRATVSREGTIYIPKIGVVKVGGVRASALQDHLKQAVGRMFKNVRLNVSLGRLRAIRVYVVGNARYPGAYTVSSLSTLVNAIFESGGPSELGSMRHIQVRRGQKIVTDLDLYKFIHDGDRSHDVTLHDNDVIIYSPVGSQVALVSNVERPGIYELLGKTTPLHEILSYAGGVSVLMSQQKVVLERIDVAHHSTRKVDDFPLDNKGLSHTLQDGDMLTFLPISPRIENAVTLRGNVAWPLRYPYKPGMKISDLIPDVDALVTKDYYQRKNILVQYEEPNPRLKYRNSRDRGVLNASQYNQYEGGRDNYRGQQQSGNNGGNNNRYLIPDDRRDALPYAGDDNLMPDNENVGVDTQNNIKNIVDEINWSYAVIERLDPKRISPQLITFNLGKAVRDHDPSQDLSLMPGDVVTIFSTKDVRVPVEKQTRFVRIEGEVQAPGIYQVQPGDRLRKVIERAGGLTPEAYVFGTEFYRESTRKQQREALERTIQQTENTINTQIAKLAVNNTARQDSSSSQTNFKDLQEAMGQRVVGQLKMLHPTGRIALELKPNDTSLDQLPDIELENSDRIVIPSRPSFVYVTGAVNNSNALIWKEKYKVKDYLKRAGATPDADMDKIFVVRADGTIVTDTDSGWFSSSDINKLVLAPGDTLVVPENIRESGYSVFMRGMRDWSQILGQFGVAAAAIKVLQN